MFVFKYVEWIVAGEEGGRAHSGRIIARGVKVTAVGSNQDLTNIDWVDLTAGTTASRQICVINNGTVPTLNVSWRLDPIDCTTIPHNNMELRFRHSTTTEHFTDTHYHYQVKPVRDWSKHLHKHHLHDSNRT